jgi:hypothetical protein
MSIFREMLKSDPNMNAFASVLVERLSSDHGIEFDHAVAMIHRFEPTVRTSYFAGKRPQDLAAILIKMERLKREEHEKGLDRQAARQRSTVPAPSQDADDAEVDDD